MGDLSLGVAEEVEDTTLYSNRETRRWNLLKSFVFHLKTEPIMANSPTDTVPFMMEGDFGTRYLITDPRSDKFLEKAKKENPNQKKFTEFCGGQGGWTDYTERWH